jgi:methyl-accepting chemotaxis protein
MLNAAGAYVIASSIDTQKTDAQVINLAGAQRMLSQRMAKELLIFQQFRSGNSSDLKASIARFELVLHGLRDGNDGLGLPPAKEAEILERLAGVQILWDHTKPELERLIAPGAAEDAKAVTRILASATNLLQQMDQIVKVLERLSRDKVQNTLRAELVVAGAAMILLALVWLGVVRPLIRQLMSLCDGLVRGAENVASASRQVSSASLAIAQGASEQAAAVEETSAAAQTVSSATQKNARHADQAVELMHEVESEFECSRESLARMLESMKELTSAADRVGGILKEIDEISFQTNILALNAAVEAARAGEAGMGFAVVANEVQNLAHRSARAARDTAGIIEISIAKSHQGSRDLEGLSQVMSTITQSTARVKELVDEMGSETQRQAKDAGQISQTVTQIAASMEVAAASAEESAAASRKLDSQVSAARERANRLGTLIEGTSRR